MPVKEDYIVTARKYRPAEFEEVVGQQHIAKTLLNAIKNNRVHHAYLFTGPRGVGKTTTARIYAREVINKGIKEKDPDSDVTAEKLDTLDIIEIDGASNNSVDDIRMLRENAKYSPSVGKYKVYIIDEVHMLSTAAFNALLKTLEEPPPHLLFVFATTEPHKLPATIISRCQRFDFRRMSIADITTQLKMISEKDDIRIDEQSLITIAKKADGSMRDSQSIFDQAIAFCGNDINYKDLANALNLIDEDFYFDISDKIISSDAAGMFEIAYRISQRGYDLRECINGLLEHFRNVMNYQATKSKTGLQISEENLEKLKNTSEEFSSGDIIRIMKLLNEAEKEIRFAFQPQIRFEFMLVTLAKLDRTKDINELLYAVQTGNLPEKKKPDLIKKKSNPELVVQKEEETQKENSDGFNGEKQEIAVDNNIDIKSDIESKTVSKPNNDDQKEFTLAEEINKEWKNFTFSEEINNNGIAMIREVNPLFENNSVTLSTDVEFFAEVLNSKKELIKSLLKDHFKSNIELSIFYDKYLNEEKSSIEHEKHSKTDKYQTKDIGEMNLKDKHPTEIYIIEKLGGKEQKR